MKVKARFFSELMSTSLMMDGKRKLYHAWRCDSVRRSRNIAIRPRSLWVYHDGAIQQDTCTPYDIRNL